MRLEFVLIGDHFSHRSVIEHQGLCHIVENAHVVNHKPVCLLIIVHAVGATYSLKKGVVLHGLI